MVVVFGDLFIEQLSYKLFLSQKSLHLAGYIFSHRVDFI